MKTPRQYLKNGLTYCSAAPSSLQTMLSGIVIRRATTHPSIACGPPMAVKSSGMVRNGPTPIMFDMFSAVAESRPNRRSNCEGAAGVEEGPGSTECAGMGSEQSASLSAVSRVGAPAADAKAASANGVRREISDARRPLCPKPGNVPDSIPGLIFADKRAVSREDTQDSRAHRNETAPERSSG